MLPPRFHKPSVPIYIQAEQLFLTEKLRQKTITSQQIGITHG
jgi:hypothetical protein